MCVSSARSRATSDSVKEIWEPGSVEHTHYLRVYMAQLRHKLETDPARPRYLLTETGVGYRLRAD